MSARLSILGMARPDAPPELGLALSQARAVRVRSHLLGLLANCPAWQDEEAMDGGVRCLDFKGWQWKSYTESTSCILIPCCSPN